MISLPSARSCGSVFGREAEEGQEWPAVLGQAVDGFTIRIADETHEVGAGDICVIPIGVDHRFESIEGEVELLEVFAPMGVQNLIGFVGNIF